MNLEQENVYKRFISNIKILECRANEKARRLNDEEVKKEAEEYRDTWKKLEEIRKRKFLSLINEENEEKKLYKKIIEILYKNVDIIDTESESSSKKLNTLYNEIKAMLSDYKIERKSDNSEEKEIKREIEK